MRTNNAILLLHVGGITMQLNRLFEIVYIMLDKRHITAKELAERFEVSVRTIYRDLDVLSSAGIPIYTLQGTGGGIYIYDDYRFNQSILTKEEQKQVLIALQSMSSTQQLENSSLLTKLNALFQIKNNDWVEIDFSRWGRHTRDKKYFSMLKDAIITGHIVTMSYINTSSKQSTRKVVPIKLIYKAKSWYLQGFDMDIKEYRIFKVSRIITLAVTDEIYDKELPNIPDIHASSHEESLITVKFKCLESVGYRLYDEFTLEDITRTEDGSFIVETTLPNDNWIYSYLLSLGSSVEILEPQSVKENIIKEIVKINKIYK